MFDQLIERIKKDTENWLKFEGLFAERKIPSHCVLLREGEVAHQIHFIRQGCLRMWFNKDGKDITFQFFFEGQAVASIDSLLSRKPSLFSIETIEPLTVISFSHADFIRLKQTYPDLEDGLQQILFARFRNYAQLFLSRIKDSPRERYQELVINHPEIIKRVPQHYIASYLGITPISLSRIKNRR